MAEEKHEEAHEGGEEGGKSKKPLIIIIAVIVVLIIVGVVVAVMMMKSHPEEAAGAEGNATTAAAGEHGKADDGHGKKDDKKKGGSADSNKAGPMLMVDNMVINLVSETGARYTKISVAIELDAPEVMLEATAKKPMIQDIVIGVISQKTADELVTYKGKEGCKSDILDKINKILHGGAQEYHMRAGTLNVPGIVGLGKAIELLSKNQEKEILRIKKLRDKLINNITKIIPRTKINGSMDKRLPNNANITFLNAEGESVLLYLDILPLNH